MATFYPFTLEVGSKNTNLLEALSSKLTNNNESFAFALAKSYIKSQQTYFMSKISLTPCQTKSPLAGSLRSCPLPNIPLCLSREEGIIFFLLALSALEKKKNTKPEGMIAGHFFRPLVIWRYFPFLPRILSRAQVSNCLPQSPLRHDLGTEFIFICWAIMSFCSWNSEKYRDHFEAGKP